METKHPRPVCRKVEIRKFSTLPALSRSSHVGASTSELIYAMELRDRVLLYLKSLLSMNRLDVRENSEPSRILLPPVKTTLIRTSPTGPQALTPSKTQVASIGVGLGPTIETRTCPKLVELVLTHVRRSSLTRLVPPLIQLLPPEETPLNS